jgi:two-component system chemotaxis response regulator CheY
MTVVQIRQALAVDDDFDFLTMLTVSLRRCGFSQVMGAEDGNIALDHLSRRRFDLIVSDWNMGVMDGVELLRRVRATPSTANTPFILVTASLTEDAWRGAIANGATEFLVKPFTLASLRSACRLSLEVHGSGGGLILPLKERLRKRQFRV